MLKIPAGEEQHALECCGYAVSGEDIFLDLRDVSCIIGTQDARGGRILFRNGTQLAVTTATQQGLIRAMRRWKINELESSAVLKTVNT